MNEPDQIFKTNSNVDAESIQSLQVICEGISKQRAIDLLVAANSNVERAIDIFFHIIDVSEPLSHRNFLFYLLEAANNRCAFEYNDIVICIVGRLAVYFE